MVIVARSEIIRTTLSETHLGSECAGADQTANRTLTADDRVGWIIVDRRVLNPGTDYTLDNRDITFIMVIDDRHTIVIFR